MNKRALVSLLAVLLVGCGAGGKVCAVIDLAAQTCTVVRYLDADGKPQQVAVTPEEARSFGMAMSAKRSAEAPKPDAGSK